MREGKSDAVLSPPCSTLAEVRDRRVRKHGQRGKARVLQQLAEGEFEVLHG